MDIVQSKRDSHNWLRAHKHVLLVWLVALFAFFLYSFFPWVTGQERIVRFNSPDETANYFFSVEFSKGAGLVVPEQLNQLADPIVRPRSTTVTAIGSVVPASFLGLPLLYGTVAIATHPIVLPFLTAFFTVLAVLVVYRIWRPLFGETVALVASALFVVHPAIWYYSARGFYHNMLFVDLLLFAWWAFGHLQKRKFSFDWLVPFFVFLGFALLVRSSEVFLLTPILIALLYHYRVYWRLTHVAIGLAIAGTFIVFTLVLFAVVYGALYPAGYALPGAAALSLWQAIAKAVLPFGFQPLFALKNFLFFGILLFLPFWVLVCITLVERWRKQSIQFIRPYLTLAGWVTVWLVVYYGSWDIHDSVGVTSLTVGSSYVRYWLPLFVLWLPIAAQGLVIATQWLVAFERRIWVAVSLLFFGMFGFGLVYTEPTEGLLAVAGRLQQYRQVSRYVNELVPANAVILSDQSDKLFFPGRRVITPGDRPVFTYGEVLRTVPHLAEVVPVYWYIKGLPDALATQRLSEMRLVLGEPMALPDGGWLYRLYRL